MGRVIHINGIGKERNQLMRSVTLALHGLIRQDEINQQARDQAAFIALALEAISGTIETSVEAWEKRGYWLKADRFRMDWAWTEKLGKSMRDALSKDDWAGVAATAAQLANKVKDVEIPQRRRLDQPWIGAWERLQSSELSARPGSKDLPS